MVLPHVDAGYNLARWLLRNDQDAEDAVQNAAVRAFQAIDTFRGSDGKSWFLSIVRNSSLNLMRKKQPVVGWDDAIDDEVPDFTTPNPEEVLMHEYESGVVRMAIEELPPNLREMIVLRDFEGMAYKEIAQVIDHPIGTVMSRLARARRHLQAQLLQNLEGAV